MYMYICKCIMRESPAQGGECMHTNIKKRADLLEGALRGNAKELGNQVIGTHDREIGRQQRQRCGESGEEQMSFR